MGTESVTRALLNWVPWVLAGLVALGIIISAFKGAQRGIFRQGIRFVSVVLAVVLCFFLVRWAQGNYPDYQGMTMGEAAEQARLSEQYASLGQEYKDILNCFEPDEAVAIAAIPVTTVAFPILFVVLFVLIGLLFLIAYGIISRVLGLAKMHNTLLTRLLGMALGAIQGIAVAGLLLMPLMGFFGIVHDSVESVKNARQEGEPSPRAVLFYDEYVSPIADNPVLKATGFFGGDYMYKALNKVRVNGEAVDMREQAVTLFAVCEETADLQGADFTTLTEQDKALIVRMTNRLNESPYVLDIFSSMVRGTVRALDGGYIEIAMSEPYNSTFHNSVHIFADSSAENLPADIETLRNIYFLLSDDGVLVAIANGDDKEVTDALTTADDSGEIVMRRIIRELDQNEHTKPLVSELSKLSVSLMAGSFGDGVSEDVVAVYENLKTGLQDVTALRKDDYETDEEYKGAVSDKLDETLKGEGIELEADIIDKMADYVADNYAGAELSDADVDDILISYYDAYKATGELPPIPGLEEAVE